MLGYSKLGYYVEKRCMKAIEPPTVNYDTKCCGVASALTIIPVPPSHTPSMAVA